MNIAEIARALHGRRNGDGYLVRCPVPNHGQGRGDRNPSLSIVYTGEELLVHCFAGCDSRAVLVALGHQAVDDHAVATPAPKRVTCEPNASALSIWRAAGPVAGTPAEKYLHSRGVTIVSASLRFHPALDYFDGGGVVATMPAMIAAVQAPDGRVVAVQRTYLTPDGGGKAAVASPRKGLGSYQGGAVRLAAAARVLGLAEGIEDAMSAMQMTGLPVWAAAGVGRMAGIVLPSGSAEVHIFANNDQPGLIGARRAVDAILAQGRRAVLRLPPSGFKDFNDVLRARASRAA